MELVGRCGFFRADWGHHRQVSTVISYKTDTASQFVSDRGDDTIKLYDWMEELRAQALKKGGDVISHLGNHEWMNVIGECRSSALSRLVLSNNALGDWRWVTEDNLY